MTAHVAVYYIFYSVITCPIHLASFGQMFIWQSCYYITIKLFHIEHNKKVLVSKLQFYNKLVKIVGYLNRKDWYES